MSETIANEELKPQEKPKNEVPEFVMDKTFTINTKHDNTSGKGIYAVSKRVKSYSQIRHITEPMVKWLWHNNGNFEGSFKVAYAVSHCQVADNPFAFFVVNEELVSKKRKKVGKNSHKNFYFVAPVIVNAQILETPEKIEANIPKRELVKDERGKLTGTKIVVNKGEVTNLIDVPEACMSFVHRTQKNIKRYYRIKVKYQIPASFLGIKYLKTKVEVVEGLKAHIFQHEIDHSQGKNMYYHK